MKHPYVTPFATFSIGTELQRHICSETTTDDDKRPQTSRRDTQSEHGSNPQTPNSQREPFAMLSRKQKHIAIEHHHGESCAIRHLALEQPPSRQLAQLRPHGTTELLAPSRRKHSGVVRHHGTYNSIREMSTVTVLHLSYHPVQGTHFQTIVRFHFGTIDAISYLLKLIFSLVI